MTDIAALKSRTRRPQDRGQPGDRETEEPRLFLVLARAEAPARSRHRRSRRHAEGRNGGDPGSRYLSSSRRSGDAARIRHRQLRTGHAAAWRRRPQSRGNEQGQIDCARPRCRRAGGRPRRDRPADARSFAARNFGFIRRPTIRPRSAASSPAAQAASARSIGAGCAISAMCCACASSRWSRRRAFLSFPAGTFTRSCTPMAPTGSSPRSRFRSMSRPSGSTSSSALTTGWTLSASPTSSAIRTAFFSRRSHRSRLPCPTTISSATRNFSGATSRSSCSWLRGMRLIRFWLLPDAKRQKFFTAPTPPATKTRRACPPSMSSPGITRR